MIHSTRPFHKTVTFAPAQAHRQATIDVFASSVAGQGGSERPNIILVTVDGVVTQFDNLLDSTDGEEWDTVRLDINIPAGATSLTVELVSADPDDPPSGNLPASMAWNAAAFGDSIGLVDLGETFEIFVDGSNTNVVILSQSGQQLQEIDFHTPVPSRCSSAISSEPSNWSIRLT